MTTKTIKHTPKRYNDNDPNSYYYKNIVSIRGNHIYFGKEFIVKACNAHDDLKRSLEGMIQFIEEYVTFDEQLEHEYPALEDSLNEAKQALLKAEGKV